MSRFFRNLFKHPGRLRRPRVEEASIGIRPGAAKNPGVVASVAAGLAIAYLSQVRNDSIGQTVNPAFIEFIGSAAACFTTAAFFPQAIKTVRRQETAGLSLAMYLMLVSGVLLWLVYGIMIESWPLIFANGIVVVPQIAILALLLKESRRPRSRPVGAIFPEA
jgi:MtN3 and saliva related transmembrane protein